MIKLKVLALFIFFVIILFHGLNFQIIGYRQYSGRLNHNYKQELNKMLDSGNLSDDDIRNAALTFTAKNLEFTFRKNSETNPNTILKNKAAHCKMYAYVFASAYNYLAKNNCSRVAYGQFYWYGINLHHFFKFSFFVNHDVIVIQNSSGKLQIIDPSLYDCFYLKNFETNISTYF